MAIKGQTVVQEEVTIVNGLPRIVWGAVIAGVLIVTAIEVALAFLGAGIGLSLTNPVRSPEHVNALSMGALVWWFSSSLVAIYLGGWMAGHFSRNHGRLHALLMWAAKVICMFVLLSTSIGAASAGAFALLNPKGTTQDVRNTAQTLTNPDLNAYQKQQELADTAARNTDMTPEEAKDAAAKASDRTAKVSLLAFVMLFATAGIAAVGGAHGSSDASKEVAIF